MQLEEHAVAGAMGKSTAGGGVGEESPPPVANVLQVDWVNKSKPVRYRGGRDNKRATDSSKRGRGPNRGAVYVWKRGSSSRYLLL